MQNLPWSPVSERVSGDRSPPVGLSLVGVCVGPERGDGAAAAVS